MANKPVQPSIILFFLFSRDAIRAGSRGKPIRTNSGFRSTLVNHAAGGVSNSQHCTSEAVDLDTNDNAQPFQLTRPTTN